LGKIRVLVKRVDIMERIPGRRLMVQSHHKLEPKTLHERDKKAGGHCVRFD
jgi:hypothetical protein